MVADDIARLAPALALDGDEVAAYEPASGYADPSATAAGFMRAARDRGARLVQGAEVTAISQSGGRVTGVETTKGSFAAPVVVNAAGGWAARVAAMAGLDIPVTVWRHDTGYVSVPSAVVRPIPVVIDNARDMYLRPEGGELVLIGLEDGNILGGSPDRETADAEPGFRDMVTDRVVQRLPGLADGTFRAAHSGQDGLTPDQRSMLGAAGPDGFYLDCGHSGTGFKTSPAIGLAMAELILDGAATSVDITPFEPGRFAEGRLLVGRARRHAHLALTRRDRQRRGRHQGRRSTSFASSARVAMPAVWVEADPARRAALLHARCFWACMSRSAQRMSTARGEVAGRAGR